ELFHLSLRRSGRRDGSRCEGQLRVRAVAADLNVMSGPRAQELITGLYEARARTLALVGDLRGAQLLGPLLPIVNPPLWELGHVPSFHEYWGRRHLRGLPPLRDDADRLYDSAAVAHDTRWDLPLPSFDDTKRYAADVLERIAERLDGHELSTDEVYFH